jgi:hypothetical protein
MKILYVKDNDDNVYMLKNRLTRADHITVASEPGKGSVFTVRLPGGPPS